MSCNRATEWLLLLAALLSVVGCGSGAPSQSSISPSSSGPQFRLDGYVVDNADGNRISAAVVDLQNVGGAVVNEVGTDTTGHFVFTAVASGSYTLRASAVGFESGTRNINVNGNLTVEINVTKSRNSSLRITASDGTFVCNANGTSSSNIALFNRTSNTVAVTFTGGYLGDPASAGAVYALTLPPQQVRTFPIVPGSYESSGQSSDGNAVLEINVWVFSRGCDFALAVCALNTNRVCQP
jgi:hypothetical protein